MTRTAKLRIAVLWFGIAAVIYVAGFEHGVHSMMETVQALIN